MYEQTNANSEVALRREARRRKILENSKNRLKLIEGIKSGVEKSSVENFSKLLTPEVGVSDINKPHHVQKSETFSEIDLNLKIEDPLKENNFGNLSDYLLYNEKGNKEKEDSERITDFENEQGQESKKSIINILLKKRLHYIFLAFFVNVLLYFNFGYLFYDNIFCPFYTVKAIELISKQEESQDLQPFLFILLATLPIRIQKFSKILLCFLSALFSDLLLYIFFFVIGTKIINLK